MALAIVFEDYTEYFDLRSAGESGIKWLSVHHPSCYLEVYFWQRILHAHNELASQSFIDLISLTDGCRELCCKNKRNKSDIRHPWDMTQIDLFVVSYIENDIFAYRLLFCGTELLLK